MKTALIVSADTSVAAGIPSNLGDAFLTESLAGALRRHGYAPQVADFGSSETTDDLRLALAGAKVKGLSQAIRAADLVLVGGGTLLQDDTPGGSSIGGLARLLAVTSTLARLHATPLAYFGVGANPVTRGPQRVLLRVALAGRPVFARDRWTEQLIAKLYGKRSEIAADTAMLAVDLPPRPSTARDSIVLAGYPADAGSLTVDDVDALKDRFGSVEFLSMSQGSRSDASCLRPEVRSVLDLCHENVTVDHALDVVAGSAAVASSRMHALYLGLLLERPLAALGDRHKVRSFREEFTVPALTGWADLANVTPTPGDHEAVRSARGRVSTKLDGCLDLLDRSRRT